MGRGAVRSPSHRQTEAAYPTVPTFRNSASRPRRNPEGGWAQVLWATCDLEGRRAALARPDLRQSRRAARGGRLLAALGVLKLKFLLPLGATLLPSDVSHTIFTRIRWR